MANTSWLNSHFPFLILFTISFWSISFLTHFNIRGNWIYLQHDDFHLKWKTHPPKLLVEQQLTTTEKDTHTSSLKYLLPRELGLPACLDNRLAHHTLDFWRVGGSEGKAAGVRGGVRRILDRRTIQKGRESRAKLVADGRMQVLAS